jgi:hypothetical protein
MPELSGKMATLERLLATVRATTSDKIVVVSNYTSISFFRRYSLSLSLRLISIYCSVHIGCFVIVVYSTWVGIFVFVSSFCNTSQLRFVDIML